MVSIIIPVFNLEKYLERCVQSVLNQNYKDIEVILVDDGSQDNSWEICRKFCKDDKRVKGIRLENGGVSRARNKGIELAEGTHIAFIDGDDYVDGRHIELLINNMEEYNVDLSIVNFCTVRGNICRKNKWLVASGKLTVSQLCRDVIEKNSYRGYVFNKLFRRELIQKNNLKFEENVSISEDLLFVIDYIARMKKGAYASEQATYYYLQRNDSAVHSKFQQEKLSVLSALRQVNVLVKKTAPQVLIKHKKNYFINALLCKKLLIESGNYYGKKKETVDIIIKKYNREVSKNCTFQEQLYILYKKCFIYIVMCLKNT